VSNFENSYLFEYLSTFHETSSVGFVISISILEKYQNLTVALFLSMFNLILESNRLS
jgi:hypothetical protein